LHGEGYGSSTIIEAASWWHSFPVEVAFVTTKNVNIKLSLKGMEITKLQVIVNFNGKFSHIAEGKLDVSREFCIVKRVTKGLIMWKS